MTKLSKSSQSVQKKWLMDAEKRGGKGTKIVVVQSQAKELIVKVLQDRYRPMNITSIYEALKAVVPSPVLKSCLDAMIVSNTYKGNGSTSYDDDNNLLMQSNRNSSKKSVSTSSVNDEFKDNLRLKLGRNSNTSLYYMNQSKLPNEGNGRSPEVRDNLITTLQTSKDEAMRNMQSIQSMIEMSNRLISEPVNKELEQLLQSHENQIQDLSDKLVDARKLKVNDSYRRRVIGNIEKVSKYWRKRKRLCVDFLNMMEECTEGTVVVKKCLAGSGQIDIESDEVVMKQAKEMFWNQQNKRQKCFGGQKINQSQRKRLSQKFVAVMLGSNATIERVYAE